MADPKPNQTPRDKILTRHAALQNERSTWIPEYKDITKFILPRSGRYFVEDRDRGKRRDNSIIDNTATRSHDVLGAGLMAGATSPARPWFDMATPYKQLNSLRPVKLWCRQVRDLILDIFNRSNVYRCLHQIYDEIGAYGTGVCLVMTDFKDVLRMMPLTAGQYCISANARGEVDTLYFEYQNTIAQLVKEYGYEACSDSVRNQYDSGNLDQWVTIIVAIEPNADRDPKKIDNKNMAWTSTHIELSGTSSALTWTTNSEQCLRRSGFKRFPVLAPRWKTYGGDIYGSGPGQQALGDVKSLQKQQLLKAQGIEYKVRPPLQGPVSMKNHETDTLPGGMSYVDAVNAQSGIRTAFEVNIDINEMTQDIQDVRQRIQQAFYTDLFLLISQSEGAMTATEVTQRTEEKMLMLGPVIERLHDELLEPLVEIAFDYCVDAGILPPIPQELKGVELQIEFVSVLAQAQRAVANTSNAQFLGAIASVVQLQAQGQGAPALDNFDADQYIRDAADQFGVNPALVPDSSDIAKVRAQRAQAAQQQQQTEQVAQQAAAAKNLSQANTTGQNGLTDVLSGLTGY